jgi:hypothetical protein
MKYEFHPAALQEYAEAVEFFAQQDKQQDFIDTIESAIFQMVGAPERWLIDEGQIRRYVVSQVFLCHSVLSLSRENSNCDDHQKIG